MDNYKLQIFYNVWGMYILIEEIFIKQKKLIRGIDKCYIRCLVLKKHILPE